MYQYIPQQKPPNEVNAQNEKKNMYNSLTQATFPYKLIKITFPSSAAPDNMGLASVINVSVGGWVLHSGK